MILCVGDGVERRVDDLDAGAAAARLGETASRARHAHEVAEGADGGMALFGKENCLIDVGDGRHADGTARPRDELDILG